jgi:hypothetical protein
VLDLVIIASLQRIEHCEIAAYGTTAELANALEAEVAELLAETLAEEKAQDARLTEVTRDSVLPAALGGGDEQEGEAEEVPAAPNGAPRGSPRPGAPRPAKRRPAVAADHWRVRVSSGAAERPRRCRGHDDHARGMQQQVPGRGETPHGEEDDHFAQQRNQHRRAEHDADGAPGRE